MSRRRGNRGRGNRSGFVHNNHINNNQKKYRLVFSESFMSIISHVVSYSNDRVAMELLRMNNSDVNTRVSYVSATTNNSIVSYCPVDKAKTDQDGWDKKNRIPIDIRKLLNKLFKKTFTKGEINGFIGRYKKSFSELKNRNVQYDNDQKILNNIFDNTFDAELKWDISNSDSSSEKYTTSFPVTPNKYIFMELSISATRYRLDTYFMTPNSTKLVLTIIDNGLDMLHELIVGKENE